MLAMFLERLPPISYDPSTHDKELDPCSAINPSVLTFRNMVHAIYIQLYNARGLDRSTDTELYERRLEMGKRGIALTQVFYKSGISHRFVHVTDVVSCLIGSQG